MGMVLACSDWLYGHRLFWPKMIMDGRHTGRWTPEEDTLFRRMAERNTDPVIIAVKLDRSIQALKSRAYAIGLPLKWFKPKPTSQE